jgi:hypothetical protein
MSNLTRGPVDLLINSLSMADFGHYLEGDVTTGAKHLVMKKAGYDFIGSRTKAVIKMASLGQKMKRTLTLGFKWTDETSKLFEIEVTRQPIYTGAPEQQFQRAVVYQFLLSSFVTTTPGTLHNTDRDAILDGLIAAIAADYQLNPNAYMTGAIVVGTKSGSDLILEAGETGTIFTVATKATEFTQPVTPTVGYMKDKLTNDDVTRIFSIKEENVGQRIVLPIAGVDYACISLTTTTPFPGIDLPSSSGQSVDQVVNIYTPLSQLTEVIADKYAADGDNAKAMGTGATADINIVSLLEFVLGSANVNLNVIATAAIAGVTAPVKNATPVTTVTETAEYTGTVAWTVTSGGAALVGNFAASTAYTATITLTPKAGKTLIGVTENFFTVAGSTADTNPANSGVVTVTFAATGA